jgi:hypothetical protein
MIEDEEGADDNDQGADDVIDCRGSAAGPGAAGAGRTEVLFRQQLVLLKDGVIVDHGLLFEGLDLAGCRTGRPVACAAIAGDGVVGGGGGAQVAWIRAHDEGRGSGALDGAETRQNVLGPLRLTCSVRMPSVMFQ